MRGAARTVFGAWWPALRGPVQFVELGDIDEIARAPRCDLRRAQVRERAHGCDRSIAEVYRECARAQLTVGRHRWHPVEHLNVAVPRAELERHRAGERGAGEHAVDGMLGAKLGPDDSQ